MRLTIEAALRADLCIGCGACAVIAPNAVTLRQTTRGFLEPSLTGPLSIEEDRAIETVCPALGITLAATENVDRIWGPVRTCSVGYATDPDTRHRGASGGALTAIGTHILQAGIADVVIASAPSPTDPLVIQPLQATSKQMLLRAAGSRYAPSSPVQGLLDPTLAGKRIAFVGKPCDIAAARALEDGGHLGGRTIVMYLSFMCAGTPTLSATHELLDSLQVATEDVVSLRYRGHGWPGRFTAILADGHSASLPYEQAWGHGLGRAIHSRCKVCADGTGELADLVFGDAWECNASGYPIFEDRPGVSLILARTERGQAILDGARDAGLVHTEPEELSSLMKTQRYQYDRKRAILARTAGRRLAGMRAPRYRGLRVLSAGWPRSPVRFVREMLGTTRRSRDLRARRGD